MIGVDKGTTYTKTDKKICIRSTIRKLKDNDIVLNGDNKIILEFNGQKCIVGEKGNYSTDLMKSQHSSTKPLILLAIGMSYPNDDYIYTDMVTSLPIGLYSAQKKAMKEMFFDSYNEINFNGKKQIIRIERVEVFPESAGTFYSQSEYEDALVINIGGLSVDTALFKQKKLMKFSTYSMGTMKLYSKLANAVNARYDLSFAEWDIEDLIKDGLYIYGQPVSMDVDDIAIEHTKEIIERLSLEYDLKSIKNILLSGGPAEWIEKYFLLDIPQIKTLPQGQFTDAIGNFNIGKVLWG